ncbi:RICIN domain-containing protein [Cystobacter fuscus]|nr:RICIN domain-containing protein [Cystobacter fuscus]
MRNILSCKILAVAGTLIMAVGCGGETLVDEATELAPDESSPTVTPNFYQVVALHSGKCMDVTGASLSDGARIIQWGCNGGNNQQFFLTPMNDGTYTIKARHSGKCVDVSSASTEDGAAVIQWECHSGNNQRFYVQDWEGRYRLVAKHSGKCLDVSGASTANGAYFIQWPCHGGDNQTFYLR